jgi:hypothetical protein
MRSFNLYFFKLIICLFLSLFWDFLLRPQVQGSCVWNLDLSLQQNIFKKADCSSNGSKLKIYSFTEEMSQMTQMSIGIFKVSFKP